MKSLIMAAALLVGLTAQAEVQPIVDVNFIQKTAQSEIIANGMINWTVGDKADYNLSMGFIKGTMTMKVHEEITEGFWLHQDVALMGQQQKVEILIDKNDGSILQLIVNGQKQEPPKAGNQEVVEMKESSVTVPKGTFDCIYVRIKDLDKNQESEMWINPEIIPIAGMIKNVAPGQFGKVVVELTGFLKQ